MDISSKLNQTATYWGNPTPDGYGGFSYNASVELDCRWEDRVELFIDAQGREAQSESVVYLDSVVAVGGYLALGSYASTTTSTTTAGDNEPVSAAKEIRRVDKYPSMDASQTLYKAWL